MRDCHTGLFISYVVGSGFHMLCLEGQHATYDPRREKVSDRRGSLGNIRAADPGPIFFCFCGLFWMQTTRAPNMHKLVAQDKEGGPSKH